MSSVELATEAVARPPWPTPVRTSPPSRKAIEVFAGLAAVRDLHTVRRRRRWAARTTTCDRWLNRVGADPARAVLEPIGGNGPQKLVTEFAGAIAAGDAEVVLILGSETGFHARSTSPTVTTSRTSPRHVGGQLEDRGYGFEQYMSEYTATHGLTGAPVQYGLLDNARRARLGLQRRRVPARDGGAVRAVLESRCQEPVLVVAGGAFGRRS